MEINYVVGDATDPQGDGPKVIVHICNDVGAWGKGFVLAISRKWSAPENSYRAWFRGEEALPLALGQVQFVQVEPILWIANLIGQHNIRSHDRRPPIRYEAIHQGLAKVAQFAQEVGASIHMPRIGTGLAGGNWDEIVPIIQNELIFKEIPVTVYDLPHK
jgi:O-acetyl-ADP-ribose deacetylase (regulator of RNase III)